MDIEAIRAIRAMRLCSNAKPSINHAAKHAEAQELRSEVDAWISKGGVIDSQSSSWNAPAKLTYSQRNTSTFGVTG